MKRTVEGSSESKRFQQIFGGYNNVHLLYFNFKHMKNFKGKISVW